MSKKYWLLKVILVCFLQQGLSGIVEEECGIKSSIYRIWYNYDYSDYPARSARDLGMYDQYDEIDCGDGYCFYEDRLSCCAPALVAGTGIFENFGPTGLAENVPWNVLVESQSGIAGDSFCGGVLISQKHVLSAAHCFWFNYPSCPDECLGCDAKACRRQGCPFSCHRAEAEDLTLYLGLIVRNKPAPQGPVRTVSKLEIHPGWNRATMNNDIKKGHDLAVLTMNETVNISGDQVKPACLPKLNYYPEVGQFVKSAGFGYAVNYKDNFILPDVLQVAKLRVKPNSTCSGSWGISGYQICALGDQEDAILTGENSFYIPDTCRGDSGSALTTERDDSRSVVIGLVSFRDRDCGKLGAQPGVYTNIGRPENLNWIIATTEESQPKPLTFSPLQTSASETSKESTTAEIPWSEWTSCSKTCGKGTRTRTRIGVVCPRIEWECIDSGDCNTISCPGVSRYQEIVK